MMREAIKNFHHQFEFQPEIQNKNSFEPKKSAVVCGMGGSHLAADIFKTLDPSADILIHSDYGLPALSEERLRNSLIIFSSYSGNTEEVLSAYQEARERELSSISISVGGKLLELAKSDSAPYIQMPDTGIQPRSALGFSIRALFRALNREDFLQQSAVLASDLKPAEFEEQGRALAEKIRRKVPVIYASVRNFSLAYNWKIKFNETGKIPAFYNVFPELNHNEMNGFDAQKDSRELSENFFFIFLRDNSDHPRIQKRFEVVEKLYRERGFPVEILSLQGRNAFYKIFSSLVFGDWTALYTAEGYGLEPEQVPLIEEFKKLIR